MKKPRKKTARQSPEAELADDIKALRHTTEILMEFGRELFKFKEAFVSRWVGPVPDHPGGHDVHESLLSARSTMQKTMVKRQALDVLKWLHDGGKESPIAISAKFRSDPGNASVETKTITDACFALHAKAVAVLLG